MSQADLNALEREVELTRAKFADDLVRLRAPHQLAAFKEDLWAHARETKDGILADLKARAAANPAAVAAVAAGVAWRLFHRPPIATLLVGVGLLGLLRTSPQSHTDPYAEAFGDVTSRASALADAAKQKVQDWSEQASQAAGDATAEIKETAAAVADRATEALRDAGDTARDRVTRLADDAASVSDRAAASVRAAMPDREDRDNYLLGAAALAVAAAVGIALQRRAHEQL
jgi:gas vesicle protein